MSGRKIINPLWKLDVEFEEVPIDYRGQFQTPPAVAKYMVSLLHKNRYTILEPTPGEGNIVRELKKANKETTAPEDFFLLNKDLKFDAVVMNPPFASKYAFLENAPKLFDQQGMRLGYWFLTECMKKSDNVIALMPWFTISDSDLRLRTLKRYGLKSLTALPRKTFKYARIQTVVIELEKDYKDKIEFKVFDF